jgi:ATP-dependent Clp protease ATP-binding subunit ClpC
MFERYTEKARRVIFFARYEASQYGSMSIETEHLLLGLFRQDHALARKFLSEKGGAQSLRDEIESQITRGERLSTAIEIPISAECGRILNKAGEESERLGPNTSLRNTSFLEFFKNTIASLPAFCTNAA